MNLRAPSLTPRQQAAYVASVESLGDVLSRRPVSDEPQRDPQIESVLALEPRGRLRNTRTLSARRLLPALQRIAPDRVYSIRVHSNLSYIERVR